MMVARKSKAMATVAAAAMASITLAACSSSESDGTDGADGASGDSVELRFAWWGGDTRADLTQQVIDLFEEQHPGITVEGESAEFGSYWPQLAIQASAGNLPDVVQFEEQFLREYSSRGALADLSAMDIDVSNYQEAVLDSGRTSEGLVSLSAGVITPAIVANPRLFEEAGVNLPDDDAWTWEDYSDVSLAISESNPGSVWGSEQLMFETALLNVVTRQNGASTYTEDGEFAVPAELLTEMWQMVLDNQESGATTPADVSVEEIVKPLEQSGTATGVFGMGEWYSHNLHVLSEAAGEELILLRMPGSANAEGSDYLKSSMSWSISAETEHPEEAAIFVDFIANDPEAQAILGTERGLPANLAARDVIEGELNPGDLAGMEFIERIEPNVGTAPILPPAGSGAIPAIFQRYTSEVLFKRLTPAEAANQFIAEVNDALGSV